MSETHRKAAVNWMSVLGLDAWLARSRSRLHEGATAAEDRMALARLEWNIQKKRLQAIAVLAVALGMLTIVTLIMLSLTAVIHFWDTPYRSSVAWGISIAWLFVWCGVFYALVMGLRKSRNPFALTRAELTRDWHMFKEKQ